MQRLELAAGEYRLVLAPDLGGSILSFEWHGEALFRPATGSGILETACFPLVPFSNRIAGGQFEWLGETVDLPANSRDVDPHNPIHGYGWRSAWEVEAASAASAHLIHEYTPGDWPWPYRAEQRFSLSAGGLECRLRLSNLSDRPMPAGIGLHPYFPATSRTRYLGLHSGEWQTGAGGLPISLDQRERPRDWWQGQPVTARAVDTVFTGREATLTINWPERGLQLDIAPDATLDCTAVYCPPDADYFCIEPVSHATNAINRGAMPALASGETLSAVVRFCASYTAAQ